MKSIFFIFSSLICVLLFSCNKNDDDNNDNPPATTREWFKLKTKLRTTTRNGSFASSDSIDIVIDSVNNKIIFKQYGVGVSWKDSSTETFSYDSKYRLVLYEHVDTYSELYISRMEFVRDANGQVTKVLSGYKNGLMTTSEGALKYDKRGDTTFITYLDSAKKHPQGYPDAQDFYQVALLNNRVVYTKRYPIQNVRTDSAIDKYEYDAAGSLISDTYQSGTSTPVVYTYQRGTESPTALHKFMEQWTGDLGWFYRSKLFFFNDFVGTDNNIAGNVLQSIKRNNVAYISYTNGFDASGNLSSVSYQTITGVGTYTTTEQYKYRP
jgi:hypothetical protein